MAPRPVLRHHGGVWVRWTKATVVMHRVSGPSNVHDQMGNAAPGPRSGSIAKPGDDRTERTSKTLHPAGWSGGHGKTNRPKTLLQHVIGLFGGLFERVGMRVARRLLVICERQPAVPHPHQNGSDVRMSLGFGETETAVGLSLEVHLLRHCTYSPRQFGTVSAGIVGGRQRQNYGRRRDHVLPLCASSRDSPCAPVNQRGLAAHIADISQTHLQVVRGSARWYRRSDDVAGSNEKVTWT
jgi:hypothetical protein